MLRAVHAATGRYLEQVRNIPMSTKKSIYNEIKGKKKRSPNTNGFFGMFF